MRHRLSIPSAALLVTVLALFIGSLGPVAAQVKPDAETTAQLGRPGHARGSLVVYHGPVEISLADADSDGHQLGDLRVTSAVTTTEDGDPLGRLDAMLTTTGVDTPTPGDEVRISTLVFSFEDEAASQLVISGIAQYPVDGPTVASGDTTVRPIVGGSGGFAGASGNAITTHLEDGTWVHEFEFGATKPRGGFSGKAPKADDGDKRGGPKRENGIDAGLALGTDESASAEVGITRTDLGVAQPASAPGLELGLWHYLIPAGSELAPHTHAGWQIARIAQGELEYTIIAGEGTLIARDGSSMPVGPGTYVLKAGDSIVENPALEHFGANRTTNPVTIVAATLYTEGAPLSLPLETGASEEPEASMAPAA